MKYLALFFMATILIVGCYSVQNQEQKARLDARIPLEVREILDKADEITISYNVDKDTMQLQVLMSGIVPNAEAKVSDSNTKQQFLNDFYVDASSNSNGAACFSPRHRLKAEYQNKVVEMDICYQCGNFKGKGPSGDFSGVLDRQGKSSALMDAIIEKYGAKIKEK